MKLLDTTIRDGSYAVDFKFTCDDVANIAEKSEKLGFQYIEIGHGQGLHASSPEHGISLHSDEEYMQAALKTVKNAKLGFFCIPGIARIEDLRNAKEWGVSFVRIGVNADQPQLAKDYIKEARRLGLTVMVNFMKSYIVSPEEFAKNSQEVERYGAEYVYIVDSAGCMLPEEIGEYYDAVRRKTQIGLGFHGHNNLGLAVSNSLYCVKKGFELVDCSFQGLGRSSGNASTEMLVMALVKMGYEMSMDIPRLLEYGYSSLRNIVSRELQHPLDLMCGFSGFHSGYLKYIYKCCLEKKVDPLRLMLAYSSIDQKGMDYAELCRVAEQLPVDTEDNPYNFREFFSVKYSD